MIYFFFIANYFSFRTHPFTKLDILFWFKFSQGHFLKYSTLFNTYLRNNHKLYIAYLTNLLSVSTWNRIQSKQILFSYFPCSLNTKSMICRLSRNCDSLNLKDGPETQSTAMGLFLWKIGMATQLRSGS